MFKLADVLMTVGGSSPLAKSIGFTGINTDSRTVKPGELFIALRGENFDGHAYCRNALQKGAGAVLIEKADEADVMSKAILVSDTLRAYQQIAHAYRMAQKKVRVIAVTGSNGKTSTKDLIAACLASSYKVTKTEANFNNEIGLPKTLLSITPETDVAVVEMGMRGLGQIRALKALAEPDIVVITNVGETHMELLGSMANIAKAKSEILENLSPDQTAVLNADDIYVSSMKTAAKIVTYGIMKRSILHADSINIQGDGTDFSFQSCLTGERMSVRLPLIGKHNVMNALAAISVAEVLRVPDTAIVDALANVQLTGKRQELRHYGNVTVINDAYNASPASMETALKALSSVVVSQKEGRAVAVLADMLELGELSDAAHAKVGQIAAEQGVKLLLTYGPQSVIISNEAAALGVECVPCRDKQEAATKLRALIRDGDVILFKGSHSMEVDKVIDMVFKEK